MFSPLGAKLSVEILPTYGLATVCPMTFNFSDEGLTTIKTETSICIPTLFACVFSIFLYIVSDPYSLIHHPELHPNLFEGPIRPEDFDNYSFVADHQGKQRN